MKRLAAALVVLSFFLVGCEKPKETPKGTTGGTAASSGTSTTPATPEKGK